MSTLNNHHRVAKRIKAKIIKIGIKVISIGLKECLIISPVQENNCLLPFCQPVSDRLQTGVHGRLLLGSQHKIARLVLSSRVRSRPVASCPVASCRVWSRPAD